ncbi:MAG: DUF1854 domain-containing protein [Eubacteriales bacterium]|nr:DUF1854 domain-containing protein [Eubacteriales bacterium]MDY4898878.1 DUF1854 domain-containing protein [Eubacteriales bacterium]
MARIYVDKSTGRIERTDLYLVKLTMNDGRVFENLEPRRLFPLTDTGRYVSLLDSKEKEIAMVKELSDLDDDSRAALEQCFSEYYLIPHITQVLSVEDKFGALSFRVMTDRGEIKFRIRNRHSDIKMLYGTSRVLIRDSDDNRYEIPCYDELDSHSKRLLFSYV